MRSPDSGPSNPVQRLQSCTRTSGGCCFQSRGSPRSSPRNSAVRWRQHGRRYSQRAEEPLCIGYSSPGECPCAAPQRCSIGRGLRHPSPRSDLLTDSSNLGDPIDKFPAECSKVGVDMGNPAISLALMLTIPIARRAVFKDILSTDTAIDRRRHELRQHARLCVHPNPHQIRCVDPILHPLDRKVAAFPTSSRLLVRLISMSPGNSRYFLVSLFGQMDVLEIRDNQDIRLRCSPFSEPCVPIWFPISALTEVPYLLDVS